MGTRTCMNASCGATSATEWKRGWELRSGGFANLCDKCGSAYEKLIFCDMFHLNESGWRECNSCGKRLHCGCIASKSSLELLDSGGIECLNCVKNAKPSSGMLRCGLWFICALLGHGLPHQSRARPRLHESGWV
ncbi:hypothetical protein MRB53_000797 [Persea americana]|uniref:Uncharacterized protein n=1 Tax=Persea americana TaxID=3435 RepID=A0ACC2MQW8_PERAE|nr:hypothetical protein MRB53_000797 [Persea americana]